MKKPFVLIAAIVAVVGFGTVAAVAKTIKVGTSVTLRVGPSSLEGTVNAKKGCEKQRRVTLTHVTRTHGTQERRSDYSDDRGRYYIGFTIPDSSGYYRTVASEKTITKNDGDKIVCKTGRSNKWRFR